MQTKHARLLFVLSIFLLSLVVIDFVRLGDKSKQGSSNKHTINLAEKVDQIGQVLGAGPHYFVKVLDKASGSVIPDASLSLICPDGSLAPVEFGYNNLDSTYNTWAYECPPENSKPKVTVTKSGYKTQSSLVFGNLGDDDINPLVVNLEKATPEVKTTTKKTETPKAETIKDVSVPDEFKPVGTQTTNLATITDPARVDNFTLDSSNNKIKFDLPVDLSATDTKNKFKTLDTYVKVDKVGTISIDSTNLPALNKPATLTMKALKFVKTPRILVNGVEDPTVAKIISYKNGILTFSVTHFSTFTAAPTVGINEPADKFETKDSQITLKGTVSDPTASVSAKLNNRNLGKLKVATNGAFQKDIDLEDGLNKIVVSALGANLATASASVSGTLLKNVNSLATPLSIILAILGILGIGILVWVLKHLMKNRKEKNKTNPPSSPNPETKPTPTTPVVPPTQTPPVQ